MTLQRPLAITTQLGFIAGATLTTIFLWKFGAAFGITMRAAYEEPVSSRADRWPLESPPQNSGDAVLGKPAVPLKYSPQKESTPKTIPSSYLIPEDDMVRELREKDLKLPVEGAKKSDLRTSFAEARGERTHEAIDILAPRNTPVVAVEDGTIAKLYYSDRGGITLYQFDPEKNYVYYYAHLERYANRIKEGDRLKKGQVVGYVGTSGNAPKDTPHLHFAIVRLNEDKHWWEGNPIDPYIVLR